MKPNFLNPLPRYLALNANLLSLSKPSPPSTNLFSNVPDRWGSTVSDSGPMIEASDETICITTAGDIDSAYRAEWHDFRNVVINAFDPAM